jgi:GxxExxY protein
MTGMKSVKGICDGRTKKTMKDMMGLKNFRGEMNRDPLCETIIGCALAVHRELGPGLLESVYETCLADELSAAGIEFKRQHPISVRYKERTLDCGFRADMVVADQVLLELKAVESLLPIHEAQLLSCMRLAHIRHGFLINFNVRLLKNGLRSFLL